MLMRDIFESLLPECSRRMRRCAVWTLVSIGAAPQLVSGQLAEVTQRVLPVAEVSNLEFISSFLQSQFIQPADNNYTSGAFLDLTRDGFGTNDVLILNPSREYFQLGEYLPTDLINVLSEQNLQADYNLSTVRQMSRVIADEAEEELDPKKALAGAFMKSLLAYYPSGDFQGYIDQAGDDLRVSFWGYEDNVWQFVSEAEQCVQPDQDPLVLRVHKQPEIQSYLDTNGCVVVYASTTAADVTSRVCE